MSLFKAKLGDKFTFYLDSHEKLNFGKTNKPIVGTVILLDHPYVLIGWKENEPHPKGSWNIFTQGMDINIDPIFHEYQYAYWVQVDFFCSPYYPPIGVACCRPHCTTVNAYAVPNQPDGSYVCFDCRSWEQMKSA